MILITGGLGFIGSHTARALVELGESCVLTQRREPEPNALLADEIGKRVFLEQVDVTDGEALIEVCERHQVTGIIHLAGAYFGDPYEDARSNIGMFFTVVNAAKTLGIRRVGIASTIGVYDGGDEGALLESIHLPVSATQGIAMSKKINEILISQLAPATGVELYATRIGAIWGPLGRPAAPFFPTSQLIHAAAAGRELDLSTLPGGRLPHADDGLDLMYVRECGRALALLQLADQLDHRVYNVSSGRITTNREIVDAIATALPEARIELPDGHDPQNTRARSWLDTGRLRQDTGYQPEYDTERAVADYLDWLRAGNER
ncbi:NAD(P)-dependent oxidoreductase [Actinospica sp.]|jgi:UDP-glucose 4-epimerase|uniref:NAD-dependent epimerase/dehydratase family protein n=1 Tax=Actinospica sp. TaxID=1872142 RepID=UPI002CBC932D|nr:NAD(P)-dependent oxidoreductase [Actinospica sp.]HWG27189.1 NAD(P)-dependent oxidoreductase [Actinospica sp.]